MLLAISIFLKVFETIVEINVKSKVLKLLVASCFVSFLGEFKSANQDCKRSCRRPQLK